MRLLVDTSGVTFTVTKTAEEKTDQNGKQKTDRKSQELLWTTQVMALDDNGGEVLNVVVAGAAPPKLTKGQQVAVSELEAIPWANNGRNGVAFRAASITSTGAQKAA